jgi:hypothetical protein
MIPKIIDTNTIIADCGLISQMHKPMKPEDKTHLSKKDRLRLNFKYLRVMIRVRPPRTVYAITEAISAPTIPMRGTRSTFSIMFSTAAMLNNLMFN